MKKIFLPLIFLSLLCMLPNHVYAEQDKPVTQQLILRRIENLEKQVKDIKEQKKPLYKSDWFLAYTQDAIILISLIFIFLQVKKQKDATMLDAFFNIGKDWGSNRILLSRKIVCQKCKDGKYEEAPKINLVEDEILGFFEDLGLLYQKKIISLDIIWESYSYYIENYWAILNRNISVGRAETKDKNLYNQFENLFKDINDFSRKKGSPCGEKTQNEKLEFIEGELEDIKSLDENICRCQDLINKLQNQ